MTTAEKVLRITLPTKKELLKYHRALESLWKQKGFDVKIVWTGEEWKFKRVEKRKWRCRE